MFCHVKTKPFVMLTDGNESPQFWMDTFFLFSFQYSEEGKIHSQQNIRLNHSEDKWSYLWDPQRPPVCYVLGLKGPVSSPCKIQKQKFSLCRQLSCLWKKMYQDGTRGEFVFKARNILAVSFNCSMIHHPRKDVPTNLISTLRQKPWIFWMIMQRIMFI